MSKTRKDVLLAFAELVGAHTNNPLMKSNVEQQLLPYLLKVEKGLHLPISDVEYDARLEAIKRDLPAIVEGLRTRQITTLPFFDPKN